jgi:hypothetical protein
MKLPIPAAIHPETTREGNAILALDSEGIEVFVLWCDRNQCGAIYTRRSETWSVHGPLQGIESFLGYLQHAGVTFPDVTVAEAWSTAVQTPKGSTH